LARHAAMRARGREIDITPSAARALRGHDWPGNVDELSRVVAHAAVHADVIDIDQLPPQVLAGNTRHLSRIAAFERGEIVRVLNDDGLTMAEAAAELGMSRATLYRKISQYNIHVPRERR
jgi:sigma-54 dependent transcriptional regulator, acetoin dehydrogenase operon transcriptional activator AcoR